MRPPRIIKPYVIAFCRSIVPNPIPTYVTVRPAEGVAPDDCFRAVPAHINRHGGGQQIGWTIWEWPKVMIEAEFHCVWLSPSGEFQDITPKRVTVPRILFAPDARRTYRGFQVDNVRKPLRRDRDLERFCEVCHLLYRELNSGELAYQHGEVPLSPAGDRYLNEKQQLRSVLFRRYGEPTTEVSP